MGKFTSAHLRKYMIISSILLTSLLIASTSQVNATLSMEANPEWEWGIGSLGDRIYYRIYEKINTSEGVYQDWTEKYFGIEIYDNYTSTYDGNETDMLEIYSLMYDHDTNSYVRNASDAIEIHFNASLNYYVVDYNQWYGFLSPRYMMPFVAPMNISISEPDPFNATKIAQTLINETAYGNTLYRLFGIDTIVSVDEISENIAMEASAYQSYYNVTFNATNGIMDQCYAMVNVTGTDYAYFWNATRISYSEFNRLNGMSWYLEDIMQYDIYHDNEFLYTSGFEINATPDYYQDEFTAYWRYHGNKLIWSENTTVWRFVDVFYNISNTINSRSFTDIFIPFLYPIGTNGEFLNRSLYEFFALQGLTESEFGTNWTKYEDMSDNYYYVEINENGQIYNLTQSSSGSVTNFIYTNDEFIEEDYLFEVYQDNGDTIKQFTLGVRPNNATGDYDSWEQISFIHYQFNTSSYEVEEINKDLTYIYNDITNTWSIGINIALMDDVSSSLAAVALPTPDYNLWGSVMTNSGSVYYNLLLRQYEYGDNWLNLTDSTGAHYCNMTFYDNATLKSAIVNVSVYFGYGTYDYYQEITRVFGDMETIMNPIDEVEYYDFSASSIYYEANIYLVNYSFHQLYGLFNSISIEPIYDASFNQVFLAVRGDFNILNEWTNSWEIDESDKFVGMAQDLAIHITQEWQTENQFIFPIGTTGADIINLYKGYYEDLNVHSSTADTFNMTNAMHEYFNGTINANGLLTSLYVNVGSAKFELYNIASNPQNMSREVPQFSLGADDNIIYQFLDNSFAYEYGGFYINNIGISNYQYSWGKLNMTTVNATFYRWSSATVRWLDCPSPFGNQYQSISVYYENRPYIMPSINPQSFMQLIIDDFDLYKEYISNFGYMNGFTAINESVNGDKRSFICYNPANITQFWFMEFNADGILTELNVNITDAFVLHMRKVGSAALPNNDFPIINSIEYLNMTSTEGGVNIFVSVWNPDGSDGSYIFWDFGDGTNTTTADGEFSASHYYTQNGTYTVIVTFTDANWDKVSASLLINICIGCKTPEEPPIIPENEIEWWIWAIVGAASATVIAFIVMYIQKIGVFASRGVPTGIVIYDEKLSIEKCGATGFVLDENGECVPFKEDLDEL